MRALGGGLLVVLLAPLLALGPALVLDRGGDGVPRLSAFPAALVVLDPLVWRCVRNSAAIAGVVTVGSLGIGTGLGMILGRRRFWGRWLLRRLAFLPLAFGPIWMTPGVVAWVGGEAGWEWLGARTFLGQPGDEWARWLALAWVEIAVGTPLAILAILAGLARVDPAWADAARVVGAGRWLVWRDVTWPTLRPGLARAGATIFALAVVEPAGPTILGLRRTLAVELADAAFRFPEPNRAATLAVIAIGLALGARNLLLRWGGPSYAIDHAGADLPPEPRAGYRLGGLATLTSLGWTVLAAGPALAFGRRLGRAALEGQPATWPVLRSILEGWNTVEMATWAGNSATAATLAVGVGLICLRGMAGGARRSADWFAVLPPLPLAIGALALPWLAATGADVAGWPILAAFLRGLRTELSPGRSPGFLLIIALAATVLPWLARGPAGRDSTSTRGPVDAALLAGATTRAARRLALGQDRAVGWRPMIVAWTWAATDLAVAWTLTALDERRTLAPAALGLVAIDAGRPDPHLLGLFALMTAIRLVGLVALAGGERTGGWITKT